MHAAELLDRRLRRLAADQLGEFLRVEGAQHGAQPVRAFRVVGAGVVVQAGAVGQQQDAHGGAPAPGGGAAAAAFSSRRRMVKR